MNRKTFLILATLLGSLYVLGQFFITREVKYGEPNPLNNFVFPLIIDGYKYLFLIVLTTTAYFLGNPKSVVNYLFLLLIVVEFYYAFIINYSDPFAEVNELDLYIYPDGFSYLITVYALALTLYGSIEGFGKLLQR